MASDPQFQIVKQADLIKIECIDEEYQEYACGCILGRHLCSKAQRLWAANGDAYKAYCAAIGMNDVDNAEAAWRDCQRAYYAHTGRRVPEGL